MSPRHTPLLAGPLAPTPSADHASVRRWRQALVGAVVVLAAAGWGHRALVARIDASLSQSAALRQPLASLPLQLGDWFGRDVPLDPQVLQAANFDDQYVSRSYASGTSNAAVEVFVGYVGRPRSRLGHRPDVCYAAHGWDQVSQESIRIAAPGGQAVPAILYEFRHPDGFGRRMLVLATNIINGRYVRDPDEFGHYDTRGPNLLGGRPAYVARVQVATPITADRQVAFAALGDLAGRIVEPTAALMPYWNEGGSAAP
jgi:EpsI family protein